MMLRLTLLISFLISTAIVVHSRPCPKTCEPLGRFMPDAPDDSFGEVVVSGDDFNGDGFADVLVGAPGVDESAPGTVYAFSGVDGALLFRVSGRENGDRFGHAIALASDFNRDGARDFIVGAPSASTLRELAGAVSIHSGRDGAMLAFFPGDYEGERLGFSLAGGHYLNNDDVPDIAAGAPGWDLHRGRVIVFSGSNWETIAELKGAEQGDRFGESITLINAVHTSADVHLVVGAPGDGAGTVSVYDYETWQRQYRFRGDREGDLFGAVVAPAGFMNANSSVDLAIAAPGYRGASGSFGRVVVIDLATGDTIHVLTGRPGEQFATAVAAAGDMKGDALSDLLVVAEGDGESLGGAYLFSGHNGELLHRYPGPVRSVSGASFSTTPGIASDDDFADAVLGYAGEAQVVDCCDCSCHGDPHCNGVIADQRDVTWAVDIAFLGKPEQRDLGTRYTRADVDCDGFTTITDIVRFVAVAVDGVSPEVAFCDPCGQRSH